jgi:predicted phosphodiesterase
MSDLHLEFYKEDHPNPIKELMGDRTEDLILAGDITTLFNLTAKSDSYANVLFYELVMSFRRVFYVLGNHEYYGFDINYPMEDLYRFLPNNVYILNDRGSAFTEDRIIFGGTLWTDYGNDEYNMQLATKGMNDYRRITAVGHDYGFLEPKHLLEKHKNTLCELETCLERAIEMNRKVIVVTHHLPSYKSIDPMFATSPLNPAFASDLDDLIIKYSNVITHWIHGHTHASCDYNIQNTRIICNPKGYFNENASFDSSKSITI